MALLFDRLPLAVHAATGRVRGGALGVDEANVEEALGEMRRHELVSEAPGEDDGSYVAPPEAKDWF